MRKPLLLAALLLAPLGAANAPVYVVVGKVPLFCGAFRRAATQVHTWCWAGLDTRSAPLVHNALTSLPPEGGASQVVAHYRGDTVVWQFVLKGPGILYQVTDDDSVVRGGSL